MDSSKVSSSQDAKLHFLDYWRIIRIRKTVILAVFLLVVITATVVTFILPETFMGMARINVQREGTDIQGMSGNGMQSFAVDPYFIQTEFEVMQSQALLTKVVENPRMNLKEKWSAKYYGGEPITTLRAITFLKGMLQINPVRNTSLIEIRVQNDNPQDAADLANAIADAYKEFRLGRSKEKLETGVKGLDETIEENEKKFREAQLEVERLRSELKVSDPDPASRAPSPMLSSAVVQQLMAEVSQREGEAAQLKTQLEALSSLSKEKLRGSIQTVVETDPVLSTLINELDTAEQNLLTIAKTRTEEHPDYQSAKKVVDQYNVKIDERVEAMMFGLQQRLASKQAYITNQIAKLAEAKKADIEEAARTSPYWEAKMRLNNLEQFRSVLQMRAASIKADLNLPNKYMVEILDKAAPNPTPIRPNKPLNIVLGVIIGLVVGIGLAFFIEYLDTSVKTIDDVERTLQSPVLGVIPQNVGFLLDEGAESPHAEAYRVLRTNLLFSRKEDKLNSIAIVSAGAGEGKSTTIFNLAAVFAQNGSRVVIVDSDLRRPTLHKMVGVTNNIGLTNYLLKQNALEEVIQTTNVPTLDFMASGKLPSSSLGILSSAQMRDLITELKRRYDFVFFDSPPIMGVSDASILASEVDMTLQVIQYRRYPQPMNIRAKQMIEKVGGNLVGIVLNNINVSQDENYYYYSGYYNEYYSKSEDSEPAAEGEAGEKSKPEIKPKY
ncbi:MAG: polysaccharide biosynthesis tyrosine autokinase [Verrucomicrobiota bacterium]